MCPDHDSLIHCLRFVTDRECQVEQLPWGPHEWLCRPGLTDARNLQLVRVRMPAGKAHQFHRHPHMEEALYYLEGRAEQWVGKERKVLGPGDVAHVPLDEVHGTYNVFERECVFLAILSPAIFDGPALVDVSQDEPWRSLKTPIEYGDHAMNDEADAIQSEPPFGARFLDEYKRLGGSLAPFGYALLQQLRRSDREGLIRVLRAAQPLSTSYATIQRIRDAATPEGLALDLIRAQQTAAASGLTWIALLALLG